MSTIVRRPDGTIDWETIRSQLTAVDYLADSDQLTPAQSTAILQARARRLARVAQQTTDTNQVTQLLSFRLADETFAIETKYVHEVVRHCRTVRLPNAPSFVVGVTNLRGEILAVMDLRQMFELSIDDDSKRQMMVLGGEQMEFGLIVNSVLDVLQIPMADVLEVPPALAKTGSRFLAGVLADATLILDGNLLLEDADLYVDLSD